MKSIFLLSSFLTIIIIAIVSNLNTTTAYASSPPITTAGAPMDNAGATCAKSGCHASTVTQTTNVIFSNIPSSGYIGGTTYNFSVTMSGSAAYGFELTPQTATSNVGLGTWIAGAGTSVSTKYIRQSAKGTGTSKTWTFQWTAPATATTVTFYGAFNYANNNLGSSGDIIKTSNVTYLANTTSIEETSKAKFVLAVFPNPTINELHIFCETLLADGKIFNVEGKLAKIVSEMELITKTVSVADLTNGVYFLQTTSNNGKIHYSKFVKN